MSKFQAKEAAPGPSKNDYDLFREGMKACESRPGRYGSKFYQFLDSKGVISIEDGELLVRSPALFRKYSQMLYSVEKWDLEEEARAFSLYPELKDEYREKQAKFLKRIGDQIRALGLSKRYATP